MDIFINYQFHLFFKQFKNENEFLFSSKESRSKRLSTLTREKKLPNVFFIALVSCFSFQKNIFSNMFHVICNM